MNAKQIFQTGISRLFFVCSIFALILIVVLNGIGLGLLLGIFALLLPYKRRIPHFLPLLLLVSMAVHLIAIFAVRTPPASDFAAMYDAAQQAAAGDFSFQNNSYFYRWAYQTAFVLYEAAVLKLTGSMAVIKILNALLLSGTNGLIYLFARRFTDERAAQSVALLYLITLFPTAMTCVLTNQHISAFFLLLAAFILTGGGARAFSIPRALLAGVLLSFGNLMRPEGIVVLAGLFGTAVFICIMRKENRCRILAALVLMTAVYFACNAAASYAVSVSGVNQYGLSNNWPEWKFIVGFNYETEGRYSSEDLELFGSNHNADTPDDVREASEEAEKQLIYERIFTSPTRLISLFAAKIKHLWCDHSLACPFGFINESSVTVHGLNGTDVYEYATQVDRTVFFLTLILALISACAALRRGKETHFDVVFPQMTLLACFCVFLLIEVQPRYAYLPQIFLYITAADGVSALTAVIQKCVSVSGDLNAHELLSPEEAGDN